MCSLRLSASNSASAHALLNRVECYDDAGLLARVTALRPRIHRFGHVHDSNGRAEHHGTIYVNTAIGDDEEDPHLSDRIHVVDDWKDVVAYRPERRTTDYEILVYF